MKSMMDRAERISRSVEACACELLDKLCEDEPQGVRDAAWTMLATRLTFAAGMGGELSLPEIG